MRLWYLTKKVVPSPGFDSNHMLPLMHLHDAVERWATQPRALAEALGGEEGLEDLVLGAGRDARALVGDC
jgi:hypothetical protein